MKWEEYEKGVNSLMSWFTDTESKIKKYRKIGHEVSVERAMKDCKVKAVGY